MICNKCGTKGILNTVLGKDFYYCRNCKDEIILQESKPEGLIYAIAIQALKDLYSIDVCGHDNGARWDSNSQLFLCCTCDADVTHYA